MGLEQKPLARADELIVRDMEGEVLVYNLANDEAISLNLFAAAVWRACDGTRSIADLTSRLRETMPEAAISDPACRGS